MSKTLITVLIAGATKRFTANSIIKFIPAQVITKKYNTSGEKYVAIVLYIVNAPSMKTSVFIIGTKPDVTKVATTLFLFFIICLLSREGNYREKLQR